MSAVNLGHEPATPVLDYGDCQYPGLTKREAFAMAAMQGILAGDPEYPVAGLKEVLGMEADAEWSWVTDWPKALAAISVAHSDALLAELAKECTTPEQKAEQAQVRG